MAGHEVLTDSPMWHEPPGGQSYVGEDAVITDGRWLCEHEDEDPNDLHDAPGLVDCPACGTRWVCWTDPEGIRLAKPVVQAISGDELYDLDVETSDDGDDLYDGDDEDEI